MMGVVEAVGYLAAVLVFLTFYMKTMVPLRVTGICSNCAFIVYGYLGGLYPVPILHCILLPLNSVRLREMLRLTRQVREATRADLSMEWLKPFTTTRRAQAGEVLFRKGDVADDMFVVVSGRFRLAESGIDIVPPHVVGELALLAQAHPYTDAAMPRGRKYAADRLRPGRAAILPESGIWILFRQTDRRPPVRECRAAGRGTCALPRGANGMTARRAWTSFAKRDAE
jgi:CRP/FNR family transcriptional regulator, cyclic AMP receptor protein